MMANGFVSRPRSDRAAEYRLRIDWKRFDGVSVVEDVPLRIRRVQREKGAEDGSDISVESLRDRVGRMDVKRLARALILLADPFGRHRDLLSSYHQD